MSVSVTLSETEFIEEVRAAFGELDEDVISDRTIMQQKDRFVIPELEEKGVDGSSDTIDTAVIALTAEKAFKSWMKKSQITAGQSGVSFNLSQFKTDLEEQSAEALSQLGITSAPGSKGAAFVNSSDGWL